MLKRRNIILWICILVVFILFLLELNKGIFYYANKIGDSIRINIYNAKDYLSDSFSNHMNQANELKRLREVELKKEEDDILIASLRDRLNTLQTLLEINQKPQMPNIYLVEAYSYVNMGKYTQVWLKQNNFDNTNQGRVFGLIKNGFSAGVAMFRDGLLLGILNGDTKASYGVYIGDEKSIGILKTDINGDVVVEYINAWNDIKTGDEIYTNGLDSIFFEGVKVGKVKNVRQEYGYIVADVDLYNKNNDVGYFWLVDVGEISKEGSEININEVDEVGL